MDKKQGRVYEKVHTAFCDFCSVGWLLRFSYSRMMLKPRPLPGKRFFSFVKVC
nr:MAG TPA: hypothetical protein [Caudoviricetes sp.]